MDKTGYHQGKHFTAYVEEVDRLRRSGQLDDAAALVSALLDVIEAWGAPQLE